jgi:zinc transporter 9
LDTELRVLLSWYAEDVMRTVEREVRHVEAEIRKEYPAADFIELEPMSKDFDRFAIDDGMQAQLRRIEVESLNRYLRSLYQPVGPKAKSGKGASNQPACDDKNDTEKK